MLYELIKGKKIFCKYKDGTTRVGILFDFKDDCIVLKDNSNFHFIQITNLHHIETTEINEKNGRRKSTKK